MEEYYNRKIQRKQKLQMIKKVCIKIVYIFLIVMLIINIISIVQMQRHPNETPNIFGLKAFCIVSGSMEPEINIHDVIVVKKVTKDDLEVGDIISFRVDGEIITHRIIQIEQNEEKELMYTTKGDANNTEDGEKIRINEIEGKCVFKIGKIGYFITLLQSKGMLTFILIVLVILYLMEYKENEKRKRRSEERADYEKNKK